MNSLCLRFSILAAILFLTCAGAKAADGVPDADEIAIYRAVFHGRQAIAMLPKPAHDASSSAELARVLKENLSGVETATIDNFSAAIRETPALTPRSDIGVKLVFVEQKDVDQFFLHKNPKEDWQIAEMRAEQQFCKHYSVDALVSVSRVGFNPGRTQALVRVEEFSDGTIYLLEKVRGRWVVKSHVAENSL